MDGMTAIDYIRELHQKIEELQRENEHLENLIMIMSDEMNDVNHSKNAYPLYFLVYHSINNLSSPRMQSQSQLWQMHNSVSYGHTGYGKKLSPDFTRRSRNGDLDYETAERAAQCK